MRVIALALALVLSTGCASVISHLPAVIAAVTDGMMVLDSIEKFVDNFFRLKPNPDLEGRVRDTIARSRSALNAALRISQGAEKLDQAQADAAFADFRAAYTELLSLLAPFGVDQQGAKLKAVPGGLIVPEPLAFKLKIQK